MNQPLYTEQDNANLNAQVEAKVATIEIDQSGQAGRGLTSTDLHILDSELGEQVAAAKTATEEQPVYPRGETPYFSHIDEAGFFNPDDAAKSTTTAPWDQSNQKIQNSTLSGSFQSDKSFTEGGITVAKVTDIINPETGLPHQFQLTPDMIKNAQAQLAEGGAVVMNQNGSTQMFSDIKDIFTKNAPKAPERAGTFFVLGKSKVQFSIDRSIFEPNAVTRLSGKRFEEKYLAQLESYIFNKQEDLDPNKLFGLIYLAGFIREGHFPIKIVSAQHHKQMSKIEKVMNLYFNKNYSVIMGIATMFNGMTSMPQQDDKKAD